MTLWDVTRRGRIGPALDPPEDSARLVAFTPGGRTLIAAGGGLAIWPWVGRRAGNPVTLRERGDLMWSIAVSRHGRTLATGNADGTIRLWDVGRGSPLGAPLRTRSGVTSLAFGPEDELASGHDDGTVRRWSPLLLGADRQAVRKRLCVLAGRNLTWTEWRQFLPEQPYRRSCAEFR